MRLSKPRFLCTILALLALATVNLTARSQALAATENILWSFGNVFDGFGANGSYPEAGPIMDASGNLYGTTAYGGIFLNPQGVGQGNVFKLTPPATVGGNWTESSLWDFGNGVDGASPEGSLIMDASGNLYGTTGGGGAYASNSFGGTVFKLTPPATLGGNWTESILWNFGNGTDGEGPRAGLIMDASGNLYGTTIIGGGVGGTGTVFRLAPPSASGGAWTESILWASPKAPADCVPLAGLIMGPSGNLYGSLYAGSCAGEGQVFELTPPSTSGGNWYESILWNFNASYAGNGGSVFGLILDATNGNLIGTTDFGGTYDGGTVFELSNIAPGPKIFVSPHKIVFPNTAIGSTATAKVEITNTGSTQLTGTVNTPSAPFGLSGSGSFNLAPGTQTAITLSFTPTSTQQKTRNDTVVSNSVNQSTLRLKLEGAGT